MKKRPVKRSTRAAGSNRHPGRSKAPGRSKPARKAARRPAVAKGRTTAKRAAAKHRTGAKRAAAKHRTGAKRAAAKHRTGAKRAVGTRRTGTKRAVGTRRTGAKRPTAAVRAPAGARAARPRPRPRSQAPAAAEDAGRVTQFPDEMQRHHETSPALSGGDVDADWMRAEGAGEETVGGSVSTPDQDVVDEIGRALGVEQAPDEQVTTSRDILRERARHRWDIEREIAEEDERRER
jgi:hypothetical protein